MLLYRLTFYPNGHLDAERLDMDDIEQETASPFEPLFDRGPSFSSAMPHAPDVTVKWTGSESGQALLTCSYQGQLFLSGVLVRGSDAPADAEILRMFTQSLESLPLLREMAGGRPDPFAALLERPERPLLAAVVWPTLPFEKFQELAGLDLLLSTVFLRRFGTS
jgi:hypothetical protein